jgi:hypothetical protein
MITKIFLRTGTCLQDLMKLMCNKIALHLIRILWSNKFGNTVHFLPSFGDYSLAILVVLRSATFYKKQ